MTQPMTHELATALTDLCDGEMFDEARCLDGLTAHAAALLDIDAAAVLVSSADGASSAVAASCETARLLQLLQVRFSDGPAVTSFRTRLPVHVPDLNESEHWESLRATALRAGYAAVHALPLHRDGAGLGALTLFRRRPGALGGDDAAVASALSTVVTGMVLDRRAVAAAELRAAQLQAALTSRVAIEQAKGALAERHELSPEQAFELMRGFARRDRRRLDEVARAVIAHSPTVASLLAGEPRAEVR